MTAQENRPSEAEAAPKTFGGVTDNDTPGGYSPAIERLPLNQLIEEATTAYLAVFDPLSPPPPAEVERDLLVATNALIAQANMGRPRVSQFRILQQLTFWQVAQVLVLLDALELDRVAQPTPHGVGVLTGITAPQRWREITPAGITDVLASCREVARTTVVDVHAGSLDPVPAQPTRGAETRASVRGARWGHGLAIGAVGDEGRRA